MPRRADFSERCLLGFTTIYKNKYKTVCFARAVQPSVKPVMRSESRFAKKLENKVCENPLHFLPSNEPNRPRPRRGRKRWWISTTRIYKNKYKTVCFARAVQQIVKPVMWSESIFAQNVEKKECKNPRHFYPLINPIGRGPAEAVNGDEYQRQNTQKMG